MNFDRLYFAKQITFGELAFTASAASLDGHVQSVRHALQHLVLFPTIAAAGLAPVELRRRMLRGRRTLLCGGRRRHRRFPRTRSWSGRPLYDFRYDDAGAIVQILCVGVWFSMLTSTNDSILLGLGRAGVSGLVKYRQAADLCRRRPLAFRLSGFTAAIAVISAGEFVKYATLWLLSHKEHLSSAATTSLLTLIFAATAIGMSELAQMPEYAGGIEPLITHLLTRAEALTVVSTTIAVAICTYKRNDLLTRLLEAFPCAERVRAVRPSVLSLWMIPRVVGPAGGRGFAERFELGLDTASRASRTSRWRAI